MKRAVACCYQLQVDFVFLSQLPASGCHTTGMLLQLCLAGGMSKHSA